MKKIALKSITLIAAGFMAINAQAASKRQSVSYDYAGLQYVSQKLDDYDCKQDGIALNGSFAIDDHIFARGGYSDVKGDACGSSNLDVGAGYHAAFRGSADAYGSVSFEDISVDSGDSDSGLVLAAGLRGYLNPQLEGKVEVAIHTAFDGDTVLTGGLAYWATSDLALTGDLSISNGSTIAIGARLKF
jgi:hypothetical protein